MVTRSCLWYSCIVAHCTAKRKSQRTYHRWHRHRASALASRIHDPTSIQPASNTVTAIIASFNGTVLRVSCAPRLRSRGLRRLCGGSFDLPSASERRCGSWRNAARPSDAAALGRTLGPCDTLAWHLSTGNLVVAVEPRCIDSRGRPTRWSDVRLG